MGSQTHKSFRIKKPCINHSFAQIRLLGLPPPQLFCLWIAYISQYIVSKSQQNKRCKRQATAGEAFLEGGLSKGCVRNKTKVPTSHHSNQSSFSVLSQVIPQSRLDIFVNATRPSGTLSFQCTQNPRKSKPFLPTFHFHAPNPAYPMKQNQSRTLHPSN